MAHDYDQENRSAGHGSRSRAVSDRVVQLPGVSLFYRILKDWQAEFRPRRY